MRGDRPVTPSPKLTFAMATPHARGSIPVLIDEATPELGYPACAGIDLPAWGFCLAIAKFIVRQSKGA